MALPAFDGAFRELTGNKPFPWQCALYQRFIDSDFPESCNLPTGLGKTNVIAVWLIALLHQPTRIPRRLVYVVNRRTVVDQTTAEVETLRANLQRVASVPENLRTLAISTLRGQFADNREWSADPSRPAVICGTVDMIGSRLLFSAYGVGFKSKPLHAGFLGQDTLLVHDEAHLEPAFQDLLVAIQAEQKRCGDFRSIRVMALTATPRGAGDVFKLTDAESKPPSTLPYPTEPIHHVWQRVNAEKGITFVPVNRAHVAKTIGEKARDRWKTSGKAVLVFVRTIDDVNTVFGILTDKKNGVPDDQVLQLTGTVRGFERDQMVEKYVFRRFQLKEPSDGRTVYLVCTSAGEVGVDISADHMVCDLTTLDSIAQRLGRVNRRGGRWVNSSWVRDRAEVDLVYESDPDPKLTDSPLEKARWKTLTILNRLPICPWDRARHEASPTALIDLKLTDEERGAAFAPPPTILPVTDILFDAWTLTTICEPLPGRPVVEPYLRGISAWQPPETHVAWRQEVYELNVEPWTNWPRKEFEKLAADLLEGYPLKPHELLRDNTARIFERLKKLRATDETPVWILADDGRVQVTTLGEIRAGDKDDLAFQTVLLPPSAGGLKNGMLVSESVDANDVADEWLINKVHMRRRIWRGEVMPPGMKLQIEIEFPGSEDEDAEPKVWQWIVRPRATDAPGANAKKEYLLQPHLDDARAFAEQMVAGLELPADIGRAVILAAHWHDLGKRRQVWQNSIGNMKFSEGIEWAKSGSRLAVGERSRYRHEFGSVLDVANEPEFKALTPPMQDLALHLIAAHHGRARPHFPAEEAFDFGNDATAAALEVPRRFARLQRRYGRWGLAYLESLVRAADILASRKAEGDDA